MAAEEETSTQPEQESNPTPTRPPRKNGRRWIISVLGLLALLAISAQLILKYYSNELFGRALRELVAFKSDGLYSLTYEQSRFSLYDWEFAFSGLELRMDTTRLRELQEQGTDLQVLYEFNIPEIRLSTSSFKEWFFEKTLRINQLIVEYPQATIRLRGQQEAAVENGKDFFYVISGYLDAFSVDSLSIQHGDVHVFQDSEWGENRVELKDFDLTLRDFRIDSTSRNNPQKPFYLSDIALTLRENKFELPSLPVSIELGQLDLSVSGQYLRLQRLHLRRNNRLPMARRYFPPLNAFFQNIDLEGLSFSQAYYDSSLVAQELYIGQPTVEWQPAMDSLPSVARNRFPIPFFHTVRLAAVRIERGSAELRPSNGKPLQLNDFDITLTRFGYEKTNVAERKKQFFSDHLAGNLRNHSLDLPDGKHTLKLREVGFSTSDNLLFINNLLIKPDLFSPAADRAPVDTVAWLLDLYCTRMQLSGANLWRLYQNRQLDAQTLRISGPQVALHRWQHRPLADRVPVPISMDTLLVTSLAQLPYLDSLGQLVADSLLLPAGLDTAKGQKKLPFAFDSLGNGAFEAEEYPIAPDTLPLAEADTADWESTPSLAAIEAQPDTLALAAYEQNPDSFLLAQVYPLVKPLINQLQIRSLEVVDGELFLDERSADDTTKRLSVKQFHFYADQLRLHPNAHRDSTKIAFAHAYRFEGEQVEWWLPDSIHFVQLDRWTVSTADSLIELRGLSLSPVSRDRRVVEHWTSTRSDVFDIKAKALTIKGFQFKKAFETQRYLFASVQLEEPIVNHFTGRRNRQPGQRSSGNPPELLRWVLDVQMTQIGLSDGFYSLNILEKNRSKATSLTHIHVCGSALQLDSLMRAQGRFHWQAEDFEVMAENLRTAFPDPNHLLKINRLGISLSNQQAYLLEVTTEPMLLGRIRDNDQYLLSTPAIWLNGLDLPRLYNRYEAYANSLSIEYPELTARRHSKPLPDSAAQAFLLEQLYSYIAPALKELTIASIELLKAKVDLTQVLPDQTSHQVSADELTVRMEGFTLDSLARLTDDHFLYADDVRLEARNFVHIYPGGTYRLQIGEVNGSTFASELSFNSFHFAPTDWADPNFAERTENGKNKVDFYVPDLKVQGISFMGLYHGDSLALRQVAIDQPDIRAVLYPATDTANPTPHFHTDSITPLIQAALPYAAIDEVTIRNGQADLTIHAPERSHQVALNQITLGVNGFFLDTALAQAGDDRLLHSDDISLSVSDYRIDLPDSLYYIALGKAGFSTGEKTLFVENMEYASRYSRQGIAEVLGHETDWIHIMTQKAAIKDFDFEQWINEGKFMAKNAVVSGMDATIYRDKRPPSAMGVRKTLPQEILRQLDTYFYLDTLSLTKSKVTYEELSYNGNQPGQIYFEDFEVYLYNMTNDSTILQTKPDMLATISTQIMGAGRLEAVLNFPLTDTTNTFSFTGEVKPADMTIINPMLEKLVFIRINSGSLKKLTFKGQANNQYSKGVMKFEYDDLKISLINASNLDSTQRGPGFSKGMATFFANALLIKSQNPRFLFLKKGKIYVERDPSKSIFNYLAKSALSGIKHSIGFSKTKPPKNLKENVVDFWKKILQKVDPRRSKFEKKQDKKRKREGLRRDSDKKIDSQN